MWACKAAFFFCRVFVGWQLGGRKINELRGDCRVNCLNVAQIDTSVAIGAPIQLSVVPNQLCGLVHPIETVPCQDRGRYHLPARWQCAHSPLSVTLCVELPHVTRIPVGHQHATLRHFEQDMKRQANERGAGFLSPGNVVLWAKVGESVGVLTGKPLRNDAPIEDVAQLLENFCVVDCVGNMVEDVLTEKCLR